MFLSHTTTLLGPIIYFLGAREMCHPCIWKAIAADSQLRDKTEKSLGGIYNIEKHL